MNESKYDLEQIAKLSPTERQELFDRIYMENIAESLKLRSDLEGHLSQKEQDARQQKLTESAININIAQTKYVGEQAEALEEQRKFSRIIKSSSVVMAWATGAIAFMTFVQVVIAYIALTKEPENPVIVRQLPLEAQPETAPSQKSPSLQPPSHIPFDSGIKGHTSRNP